MTWYPACSATTEPSSRERMRRTAGNKLEYLTILHLSGLANPAYCLLRCSRRLGTYTTAVMRLFGTHPPGKEKTEKNGRVRGKRTERMQRKHGCSAVAPFVP